MCILITHKWNMSSWYLRNNSQQFCWFWSLSLRRCHSFCLQQNNVGRTYIIHERLIRTYHMLFTTDEYEKCWTKIHLVREEGKVTIRSTWHGTKIFFQFLGINTYHFAMISSCIGNLNRPVGVCHRKVCKVEFGCFYEWFRNVHKVMGTHLV